MIELDIMDIRYYIYITLNLLSGVSVTDKRYVCGAANNSSTNLLYIWTESCFKQVRVEHLEGNHITTAAQR